MQCHYHFNDGGAEKERKRQRTNDGAETKRFLREGRRAHKTPQRRKLHISTVTHVNCRVGVDLSSFAPFISVFPSLFPSLFLLLVTTEKTLRHRLSLNGK